MKRQVVEQSTKLEAENVEEDGHEHERESQVLRIMCVSY